MNEGLLFLLVTGGMHSPAPTGKQFDAIISEEASPARPSRNQPRSITLESNF